MIRLMGDCDILRGQLQPGYPGSPFGFESRRTPYVR